LIPLESGSGEVIGGFTEIGIEQRVGSGGIVGGSGGTKGGGGVRRKILNKRGDGYFSTMASHGRKP
jgi:hypothetical protein